MKKNTRRFLYQSLFMIANFSLFACSNKDSKPAPISVARDHSIKIKQEHDRMHTIIYNRSYDNTLKGSYNGHTYRVKRGDTLFYIAWLTGNDYRDLAKKNNIPEPYTLKIHQLIQLDKNSKQMIKQKDVTSIGLPLRPSHQEIQTTMVDSQSTNAYSEHSGKQNVSGIFQKSAIVAKSTPDVTLPRNPINTPKNHGTAPTLQWKWPTDGKIIDQFSASEGGNKGIDISGSRRQPIFSTADGQVVYSGNALRGYGNLIIIKHSDDYLSAYAHNDKILVREQQKVKAGQKIATMGSSGSSSVKLHFEIRYKGKSVNPLQYLSQR
ncbi:peptidase M23 [Candidatus Williamhamiltonella defendens]|uniref:Murein hydrolase activator NlpD n=1 Tax=Candidatus Williamhamiltonella defendens TaxID=138072 RepID=A0AAC9YF79_9ENTR|nr:peptidase M23 [Candidatus Hamiltonella defensa]AWK15983.1 peptidase M23 [Candidatus Hamiltonella defensa]